MSRKKDIVTVRCYEEEKQWERKAAITFREIGEILGISKQRVNRIVQERMRKK